MFQSAANASIPLLEPTIPLIITEVHHTAAIRVDECGSEMSAATSKFFCPNAFQLRLAPFSK